jgi:hypothetical protein
MPLPTSRTDAERIKGLEQALDALYFACETVKDVMPNPESGGFVSIASELQTRIKVWREEIEKEAQRSKKK